MAYLYPHDLPREFQVEAPTAEIETLVELRRHLDDRLVVFHGVHWTNEHRKFTVYGEIDFVVISPAGRILVIEQKNGQLEETSTGLTKHYRGHSKEVSSQIQRSIQNIRTKFSKQNAGEGLDLDYLVYCPDYQLRGVLSAGLDESRIIHAGNRDQLTSRIEALLSEPDEEDRGKADRVKAFFTTSFGLVPDIHAHNFAQEKQFIRLTEGLAAVVSNIEMKPLRLRVKGTAGCGKSLVSLRMFATALTEGKRPLLVCFNRPLAMKLKASVPKGGLVQTFHGLCHQFLKSKGREPDFTRAQREPDFWEEFPNEILEVEPDPAWVFDALIVDEGQDFSENWRTLLDWFLKPDADVLWLEDHAQNIKGGPSVALEGFVAYRATDNHRTPPEIAAFIQGSLGEEFNCANPVPGLGVRVTGYDVAEDQPVLVGKIVAELRGMGFSPDDIAVISLKHRDDSAVGSRDRVGNFTLRRFTGEYDLFGNQTYTKGQLIFDSIYRFKGQQAAAVILTDVDPDDEDSGLWHRLLYCGMTRATLRLEVLARSGHQNNRLLFEADQNA